MNKSDNYSKFIRFRKQYKRFTYESFDFKRSHDSFEISFDFNLDNKYFFCPSLQIPVKPFINVNFNETKLRNIIFHIGMVELLSYWKAACPKEIVIKPYYLNEEQKKWWKNLYYNGLGEFFYLNSINTNVEDFVDLISESDDKIQKESFETSDSVIIPVGGGKDSSVTLELLSESLKNNLVLIINPRKASTDTAITAGYNYDKMFIINRTIDPVLLKMNDEGFLNGHTPFSALLAFVSLLAAAMTGKKHIALSNESSANESTIGGTSVNHQYSKSYEFEKDFREYYLKYITADINYFSLLRPINEIQIAKLFSTYPKYFNVFKSCNAGSKTDSWCGNCPKCLFTYIVLSVFLGRKKLTEIFNKDILDDKNLLNYFNELTGIAEVKPFECVGTVDEVNVSLCEIIKHETSDLPYLLKYYKESEKYKISHSSKLSSLLNEYNHEHFLTTKFEEILKRS